MTARGAMDGWHGDEDECNGHCGLCDDCDERKDRQDNDDYSYYQEFGES